MDYHFDQFGTPERTVTVADIDAAPTTKERIALMQVCLEEENRHCSHQYGYYWAFCTPLGFMDVENTPTDNLMWETMNTGPRRPLYQRLYAISGLEYNGYIDVKAHCQSIIRHDATHDAHPCINRDESCYRMRFNVVSYALHPMPGYKYPQDLDIFKRGISKSFEVIYSHKMQTGRLVGCGGFYSYVLPDLAATDGLMQYSVLHQLNKCDKPVPNILNIEPLDVIVAEEKHPNI